MQCWCPEGPILTPSFICFYLKSLFKCLLFLFFSVGLGNNVVVGDGVSVLHSDGNRYECKVKDVEDTRIYLHWHGYGKISDFWLDLSSDELGPLEEASVLPPPPTKSMKNKVRRTDLDHTRRSSTAGVSDQRIRVSETDDEQSSSGCTRCSGEVFEDHLNCDFCSKVTHLSCSNLPDYMLVRFLKSDTGFMCESCVRDKWSSDKIFDAQNRIRNTKQKEKEAKQDAVSKRTSVAAPTSPKAISLCQRYRRCQCPHGLKGKKLVEGKKCAYAHPPKCRKFLAGGNDKRFGCKEGKKCKFLHPILCPSSGKGDVVCSSESCKLVHLKGARHGNVGPDSRGSQSRVTAVTNSVNDGGYSNNSDGNTNRKAATTAGNPLKNDQLERIEQTILSMKATHDAELKALRQELVQCRGPPMPWMIPNYPWVGPPFGVPAPTTSLQQQVPMSCSHRI